MSLLVSPQCFKTGSLKGRHGAYNSFITFSQNRQLSSLVREFHINLHSHLPSSDSTSYADELAKISDESLEAARNIRKLDKIENFRMQWSNIDDEKIAVKKYMDVYRAIFPMEVEPKPASSQTSPFPKLRTISMAYPYNVEDWRSPVLDDVLSRIEELEVCLWSRWNLGLTPIVYSPERAYARASSFDKMVFQNLGANLRSLSISVQNHEWLQVDWNSTGINPFMLEYVNFANIISKDAGIIQFLISCTRLRQLSVMNCEILCANNGDVTTSPGLWLDLWISILKRTKEENPLRLSKLTSTGCGYCMSFYGGFMSLHLMEIDEDMFRDVRNKDLYWRLKELEVKACKVLEDRLRGRDDC